MTNEEAIIDIRDNIQPIIGGKSLDIAISAIEKQIPKKCVTNEGRTAYRCPLCGKWFIGSVDDMIYCGVEPNFCFLCGQALDWGKEEEE